VKFFLACIGVVATCRGASTADQVFGIVDALSEMQGWEQHIWSLDFSILVFSAIIDFAFGLGGFLLVWLQRDARSLLVRGRWLAMSWAVYVVVLTIWNWDLVRSA
jgi:hypothetical protein